MLQDVQLEVAALVGALQAARRHGDELRLEVVGAHIDRLAELTGVVPVAPEPCPACGGVNGYHACDEAERSAIASRKAPGELGDELACRRQALRDFNAGARKPIPNELAELVYVSDLQPGDVIDTWHEGPATVESVVIGPYDRDLGGRHATITVAKGSHGWTIDKANNDRVTRVAYRGEAS